MRGTRWLAWACLAAVLAGCSTSAEESGDAASAQLAPAETEAPVGADAGRAARPIPAGQLSPVAQPIPPGQPRAPGRPIPPAQPSPLAQRQVVREVAVELRVENVADATERVRLVGPAHGGFVATEESGARTASVTLRVAAAELDATLTALAGLGEVTSRSLDTKDVTEEAIDLDARIASQRASVERVRALLDQATTIGEVVQVEYELTTRQAELESLQQRAVALADQVALSTVRVRLVGPDSAPAAAPAGFGSGLAAGWAALRSVGRVALQVLGAVLPFAMVLALPGGALLWYRRRRRVMAAPPVTGGGS